MLCEDIPKRTGFFAKLLLLFGIYFCYNNMKSAKFRGLLLLFPLLLVFFSCSASIEGELKEGGVVDLSLKTALQPRMISLIQSLRNFMGEADDAPILDGRSIGLSIAASPGVRDVSLRNTGPAALDGAISISKVDEFLTAGGSTARLVTYTEGQAAGTSSLVIFLEKASAPEIISRLSAEAEEYLSALMAPAVLGEDSTKEEYLRLISMVYGRALADEISASRLKIAVNFPRTITSVKGGTSSGRRAEFDVPILDILVLEQPLRYEVLW